MQRNPRLTGISRSSDRGEQHLSAHQKGTVSLVTSYLQAFLAQTHLT